MGPLFAASVLCTRLKGTTDLTLLNRVNMWEGLITSLTSRNADLRKPHFPLPRPPHCPHLCLDDSPILLMGHLAPPLLSPWDFAQQRPRVSSENKAFKRLWGGSLKAGLDDHLWDLLLFPLPSFCSHLLPPHLLSSCNWPPCCSRQAHSA